MPTLILLGLGILALLVVFGLLGSYLRLWRQAYASSAGIGLFDLVDMSFKKINPTVIVRSKIMAVQAGLGDASGVTLQAMEAHFLAGGRVPLVIQALIAANKAKIKELDWKLATAIDLAGRNVREAVQTSVYPKVIDCPGKNSGRESLDAVAKNGIQLKVKARVTVRTNLNQLIGGATEETIIARVG
ncbi:MAG: flotillin-like FloA family protein, partial [Planctomycetia bacterium]